MTGADRAAILAALKQAHAELEAARRTAVAASVFGLARVIEEAQHDLDVARAQAQGWRVR